MGAGGTGARSRSAMRVERCMYEDVFCWWEEDYVREFPDLFGGWPLRRV